MRHLEVFLRFGYRKQLTFADIRSECKPFPKLYDANERELLDEGAAMGNRTDLPPVPVDLDAGIIDIL